MNSQVLSLNGKLPGGFDRLLPKFLEEVIEPLIESLDVLQREFMAIHDRRTPEFLESMGALPKYLPSLVTLYDA